MTIDGKYMPQAVSQDESLKYREVEIENLIADLINKNYEGSWLAVETGIAVANDFRLKKDIVNSTPALDMDVEALRKAKLVQKDQSGKERLTIDRRKLQKLSYGKLRNTLSLFELILLDTYFIRFGGRGLAELPIFRRSVDLFQLVSNADRVSFFVGARAVKDLGDMIAWWDMGALSSIRDRITHKTETFNVPTRDAEEKLSQNEWRGLRRRATGNVVISIGSPVASASSEYLMAEMFDFPAYRSRSNLPPVHFAHPKAGTESGFVLSPRDVEGVPDNKAAVIINGKPYVSNDKGLQFGVVIGQRTGPDHADFLVAGSTGPATTAAAEFFSRGHINVSLPKLVDGNKQPVMVSVISTKVVSSEKERRIDHRVLEDTAMVGKPVVFEYVNRQWQTKSPIDDD